MLIIYINARRTLKSGDAIKSIKDNNARNVTLNITSILQCPVSGTDLSFVDEQGLREMNTRMEQGVLRHLNGKQVQLHLESALISSDRRFVYPVVDGIMILLPSLAITQKEDAAAIDGCASTETDQVMRFYDELGWQVGKAGHYLDAEKFADLRPVSREYVHRCHLRINQHIAPRGMYLLDVASGPVQYPEYLTYSEGYDRRICADVSFSALQAAKAKLGDRGVYIQCDITQLPLKEASVDGFVSLHTIYHVPAEKQETAFRELERVLMPERTGVVVYSWGSHCLAMKLLTAEIHPFYAMKQWLKKALPPSFVCWLKKISGKPVPVGGMMQSGVERPAGKGTKLYFYPHNYRWFQQNVASRGEWRILVWRSVSVAFLKRYVHARLMGKAFLAALFRIENAFPRFWGRFGQYPLMVYRKPKAKSIDADGL